MSILAVIAADLVVIMILTFAVYFPRHHRRDLVVAFLGVNVGVLAVCIVLGSATVGAGLGLGMFGSQGSAAASLAPTARFGS